jgi:hypothetical protein
MAGYLLHGKLLRLSPFQVQQLYARFHVKLKYPQKVETSKTKNRQGETALSILKGSDKFIDIFLEMPH